MPAQVISPAAVMFVIEYDDYLQARANDFVAMNPAAILIPAGAEFVEKQIQIQIPKIVDSPLRRGGTST